ncbi:hypothetical protein C8Q77DRAFT_929941 [Trametes polyzona]|nr:hypothetical protein C8Q77DRAFT_929941 [Trametes polyzona]
MRTYGDATVAAAAASQTQVLAGEDMSYLQSIHSERARRTPRRGHNPRNTRPGSSICGRSRVYSPVRVISSARSDHPVLWCLQTQLFESSSGPRACSFRGTAPTRPPRPVEGPRVARLAPPRGRIATFLPAWRLAYPPSKREASGHRLGSAHACNSAKRRKPYCPRHASRQQPHHILSRTSPANVRETASSSPRGRKMAPDCGCRSQVVVSPETGFY